MAPIVKINGLEIPADQLYAVCKKVETIKGACDMMDGNQMEIYLSLKLATMQYGAENADKFHHSGSMGNLVEVGLSATKFLALRAFEGVGVVGHIINWSHSAGLPIIHP